MTAPVEPKSVTTFTGTTVTTPAALPALVGDAVQPALDALSTQFRRGWHTSEFWVAITTWLLPIATLIFHKDLSNLAVPISTLAAGLANGAYAISRSITKSSHAAAVASTAAQTPAAVPAASALNTADVTTWISTMAGAVQALTSSLNHLEPNPPKVPQNA